MNWLHKIVLGLFGWIFLLSDTLAQRIEYYHGKSSSYVGDILKVLCTVFFFVSALIYLIFLVRFNNPFVNSVQLVSAVLAIILNLLYFLEALKKGLHSVCHMGVLFFVLSTLITLLIVYNKFQFTIPGIIGGWIFYSLAADESVSKLTNEIISGVSTFLFTGITYFALYVGDRSFFYFWAAKDLDKNIVASLSNVPLSQWNIMSLVIQKSVGLLLPIIGITSICVLMINLKHYWKEKYDSKQN